MLGVIKYLLRRNRAALHGLVIIALFLSAALTAPYLAPWRSATDINLQKSLLSPSFEHILGTDLHGRDLLIRLIWGARVTLAIALASVIISILIGIGIGAFSGFYDGPISFCIMRLIDSLIAFPKILLAIVFITILGPSLISLMFAIGVSSIPIFARLVRGPVLSIKKREFVQASIALGSSDLAIILKHILPNILSLVIVQGTISIAEAILIASSLSFLGLGPQPPIPEWGAMISASRAYLTSHPHLVMAPGMAIFLAVLAFNLFGDGLRDALDPRIFRGK